MYCMAMVMSGRALLPSLLRRAQRRAAAPSKCGCIAGWETAVHSAGGRDVVALLWRDVVALWWSASCTLYYQKKDSQSFRSAVVLVK